MKIDNTLIFLRTRNALEIERVFLVLATTSLLPFLLHLFPSWCNLPAGAILLPVFYAPFIAAIRFRLHISLSAALLGPAISTFLTQRPAYPVGFMLTIELVVFCIVSRFIFQKFKNFWLLPLITYAIAKFTTSVFLNLQPAFAQNYRGTALFLFSIKTALPGLIILCALNIYIIQYIKKEKH